MDHVDAINQAFAEFEFAYHNQFHKAFSDAESLVIAKKYWLSSLDNYAPRQIVLAAKKVIKTQDYLPSIAALVRACIAPAALPEKTSRKLSKEETRARIAKMRSDLGL